MVRAAAGLEISLSTPADKVTSMSELRVIVTVKNVGDEDLKIVKPGTVLDKRHPTQSFIVTKDGTQALRSSFKCNQPVPCYIFGDNVVTVYMCALCARSAHLRYRGEYIGNGYI